MACYRLYMRRAALIVVASLASLAGCAEGEKDVPFAPSDAAIDVPVSTTDATGDVPPEPSCVPEGAVACTVFPQCGCTATQNCNVTSMTGETTCVAAGTDGLHEACGGAGECQKGMQCVGGLCVPFCASDADCTIAGSPRCKTVQTGLKVCLAQCDVRDPAAVCGANRGCFFPFEGDDTTECSAAAFSTVKGGCTTNKFACAPGYTCVNNADCFKWCRMGTTGDCVSGQTCTSLTPKVTKGTVEYGTCTY